MIGWLHGRIIDKPQPGKLVLDVNGVGYDIETSLFTFFQLETEQQSISLHIHTIVREDALLLYGFLNQEERALFRSLIKVNGIGPKMAIAILSSITPNEFIQTIQAQNTALLTKLPGIGKKTAERLVMEMKDNLSTVFTVTPLSSVMNISPTDEAANALEALGYKRHEITKVMQQIDDGHQSCEQLIRLALQRLSVYA